MIMADFEDSFVNHLSVKLISSIKIIIIMIVIGTHKRFSWGYKRSLFFVVNKGSLLAG